MTASLAAARAPLLMAGLAGSLALRLALGPQEPLGALGFAALLLTLACLAPGTAWRVDHRSILSGLLGAGVLIGLPIALGTGPAFAPPVGAFAAWAPIVALVAVAEEYFLRGALFAAIASSFGAPAALAVTSIIFALLHVPLYGWQVVPLDLAVGLWLGSLRIVAGSPTAPAIAHVLADLATWWLP